jgi:hypothetical protein
MEEICQIDNDGVFINTLKYISEDKTCNFQGKDLQISEARTCILTTPLSAEEKL